MAGFDGKPLSKEGQRCHARVFSQVGMISALTHASTMVWQWRFSVKTCHETEVRWRGPGNIDSYGAPVRGTRAEPHAEAYERASSAKRKARNGQRDFKKGQEEPSPIPMSFTHTQRRRKERSYGRRRWCTRRSGAHKASQHGAPRRARARAAAVGNAPTAP